MRSFVMMLVLFVGIPAIVHGEEVYRWIDEEGIIHFTDNPENVPENYAAQTETREMPVPEQRPVLYGTAVSEEDGILIEDDLKEKDEAWWRNRAEKWRARLQAGYDQYEEVRLRYNALATEFNATQDPDERKKLRAELDKMQAAMDRFKTEIEESQRMIEEVLPSQAQKAGKPLEWLY